jgi:hypothetical protein
MTDSSMLKNCQQFFCAITYIVMLGVTIDSECKIAPNICHFLNRLLYSNLHLRMSENAANPPVDDSNSLRDGIKW